MLPAAAGVAAIGSLVAWLIASQCAFAPEACPRVESYLSAHVVGQDLATRQLTDAICHHLATPRPGKPLIISAHGPPGVGKTLSHQLLARALYSRRPSDSMQCPGKDCKGYKVFYGMDYLVAERSARLGALRDALVSHLRSCPEALIVVEEYDKLDCDARGLWRQLLQHPERANVTWDRAVVIMESNLGMSELEQLLTEAGSRGQVSPEAAERTVRELVFAHWQSSGCEPYEDTLKLTSLVDFYLPYLPLERPHLLELARRALVRRGAALLASKRLALAWGDGVAAFLVDRVEFAGPYPMEGAKGVESAVTRHVARLLRHAPKQAAPAKGKGAGGGKAGGGGGGGRLAPAATLVLSVAEGGKELAAKVVPLAQQQDRQQEGAADEQRRRQPGKAAAASPT